MTNQAGGIQMVLHTFLGRVLEAGVVMTQKPCFAQELQRLRSGDMGRGYNENLCELPL